MGVAIFHSPKSNFVEKRKASRLACFLFFGWGAGIQNLFTATAGSCVGAVTVVGSAGRNDLLDGVGEGTAYISIAVGNRVKGEAAVGGGECVVGYDDQRCHDEQHRPHDVGGCRRLLYQ